MYRLLIVDDEWDVADALYDQFRSLKSLDLDVYKAYSAGEALAVLNSRKIDIVMTDVRMPGMDGLQLLEHVRARWPECPVIFLTGYGGFDAIYSASRQGNVTYLLKTESPEAITGAVEAAARGLDERSSMAHFIKNAQAHMQQWLPVMQRDCLRALLEDDSMGGSEREAQFAALGIPLDAAGPVLLLAALWPNRGLPAAERSRQEWMIRAASADCFSARVAWAMVSPGRNSLVWLLQPHMGGPDWAQLRTQALGSAEALQTVCSDKLGLSLCFAVDDGPAAWKEVPGRCDALRQTLRFYMGQGRQQILLDGASAPRGAGYRAVFRKVKALEDCLEDGRQAEFERLLTEVSAALGEETTAFFRSLAHEVFSPGNDGAGSASAIVARVCRYISAHLEEDLSLARLADMVYFNPSYLSRVFKQVAGENVIERINGARVARARELLATTRMKIKDISLKVGYESPSYFTQFFKRETGISPQEYRDSCRSGQDAD